MLPGFGQDPMVGVENPTGVDGERASTVKENPDGTGDGFSSSVDFSRHGHIMKVSIAAGIRNRFVIDWVCKCSLEDLVEVSPQKISVLVVVALAPYRSVLELERFEGVCPTAAGHFAAAR